MTGSSNKETLGGLQKAAHPLDMTLTSYVPKWPWVGFFLEKALHRGKERVSEILQQFVTGGVGVGVGVGGSW